MLMLPVRGERYVPLSFTNRFRCGCLKCTFSEATEHVKKVHVVLFFPTKCSKWKFAIYLFNGHLGYLLPAFTGTFPVNGSHLCKWYTWFGNEYHTIHRFCFPFANRKPIIFAWPCKWGVPYSLGCLNGYLSWLYM